MREEPWHDHVLVGEKIHAKYIHGLYTGEDAMKRFGDEQIEDVKTFNDLPKSLENATLETHLMNKQSADNYPQLSCEAVPSDNERIVADDEDEVYSTSWIKVKEIEYGDVAGTIQVKFEISQPDGYTHGEGAVFKNGVITAITGTASAEWTEISGELEVEPGDLVQLYLRRNDEDYYVVLGRNLSLNYDKQVDLTITPGTVNMN